MSKRRKSSGFSLIELIVAVLLSSVVLMGSFSILTNMINAEVNGMRAGTVTAYSLAGITMMNTDISGASALSYPGNGGPQGDNSLVVCTKWSTKENPPGGSEMMGATGSMQVINYCWDQDPGDANTPFENALLRKVQSYPIGSGETCPTAPIPCNQASYTGGDFGSDTIVATGVYLDPNNPYVPNVIFTADPYLLNAVKLRYVIGDPNASAVSAGGNDKTVTGTPVSTPFATEIVLED